nr:MAG TPA: hypothetical protein [Caudoviricetes sp.]
MSNDYINLINRRNIVYLVRVIKIKVIKIKIRRTTDISRFLIS